MIKEDKKGQFYIMAAVLIIFAIIGFATAQNYIKTEEENTRIYNIGEELLLETGSVYDYGTYQEQDTETVIEKWAGTYSNYIKENGIVEDWIFIYGNEEGMTALAFVTEESGSIGLSVGDSDVTINIEKEKEVKEKLGRVSDGKVKIVFNNMDYKFYLEKGENFFFIIKKDNYIEKNE